MKELLSNSHVSLVEIPRPSEDRSTRTNRTFLLWVSSFRLTQKKLSRASRNISQSTIRTIRKTLYRRLCSNRIKKKYVISYAEESSINSSNPRNTPDSVNGRISSWIFRLVIGQAFFVVNRIFNLTLDSSWQWTTSVFTESSAAVVLEKFTVVEKPTREKCKINHRCFSFSWKMRTHRNKSITRLFFSFFPGMQWNV